MRKTIPNRVLSLNGPGDYVEMADSEALNDIGSQVTMEAWIKPEEYKGQWVAIIYKGDKRVSNECRNRSYALFLNSSGFMELASAPEGQAQIYLDSPAGLITLNSWYHVAGVIDSKKGRMKIFINGVEAASGNFGKDIHISTLPLRIGWFHEEDIAGHVSFAGQIDEARIWNTARTQEEIQQTMFQTLSGKEPGLVGYWNFDGDRDAVTDLSPIAANGKLMRDAHFVTAELPGPEELTVVSGVVRDESGNPISDATVRLERDRKTIISAQSGASGRYFIASFILMSGSYDLFAGKEKLGVWHIGMPLVQGEKKILDLVLKENICIEGTLLMLDGVTSHVAVVVQAVRDGEVMATALSDEDGKYQFINLEPGIYQVRCYTLNGYLYYGKDNLVDEVGAASLQVGNGEMLDNIDFRFAPFKKGIWRSYTSLDGLANNTVRAIYSDPDGIMWFGTDGGGVSRFDGREFINFTIEDGLADNTVCAIYRDTDGIMWFGTGDGISRYDGKDFVNFTTEDGLVHNWVNCIYQDFDGMLWFGTGFWEMGDGGISCYDGKTFVNFTREHGLNFVEDGYGRMHGFVTDIYQTPDGILWFATVGGVFRYDRKNFSRFTIQDGLPVNAVNRIYADSDGVLWFGTWFGLSRYDGQEFVNFTTANGLGGNVILDIHRDPDGVMWFGTGWKSNTDNGVSRYDGETFVNFTLADGLANNDIRAIYRDANGALWVGTEGGGILRYDEKRVTNLTTRDGLAHNFVTTIYSDSDGITWLGTDGGVSRYDGQTLINFTQREGFEVKNVWGIYRDPDGTLWFGERWGILHRYAGKILTDFGKEISGIAQITTVYGSPDGTIWIGGIWEGVSHYDGNKFLNYTTKDGLAHKFVWAIHCDPDGIMWFGTWGGVSRYDGKKFINLTIEDGLTHNSINSIHRDPDGIMWFGTQGGGVSRYDGQNFVNFTTRDGLVSNNVLAIYRTSDDILWFGTDGGACCYDGITWMTFDTRDGLAGNNVNAIYEDSDGSLLFATNGGLTRYRRDAISPRAHIVAIVTDRRYTDLDELKPVIVGTRITFEYSSIDFKTHPDKRLYRYKLEGHDADWVRPTLETQVDYVNLPIGKYAFLLQAIDIDLNYSEPESLEIEVIPDPRNHQIAQLKSELAERERAEMKRMQQELEDARQIQLSLLPEKPPEVEGFQIAGISRPAREVSGDFYNYLRLGDNLCVILGDVTGKSVKAAMVAAMTNGVLHEAIKIQTGLWDSPSKILRELNTSLQSYLIRSMNTAMSLGIIQPKERRLIFSNAGMPYPVVKRAHKVWEMVVNGLPLGITDIAEYEDLSFEFDEGDFVVFCSDGVIEAENRAGEMYQSERLLELVKQADPNLSAQGMVDLILGDVMEYVGDEEASDDITVVVIKCWELGY